MSLRWWVRHYGTFGHGGHIGLYALLIGCPLCSRACGKAGQR